MAMCMVRIGDMSVRVIERFVTMPVAVRTGRHRNVHVLVVTVVVPVRMFVFRHLMSMLVSVRLRQMQHYACKHQHAA